MSTVPSEPSPPRPSWVARHRLVAAGLTVLLAGVLVVGGCYGLIRIRTAGQTYSVADVPAAPVALVLGAGLTSGGRPSQYLENRLDVARQLWARHKVKALLVSGDNSTTSHDEVNAMRDWLIAHDVPAEKVVRDYAGFDTYASCVRGVKVFGVRDAIIVSQAFHLPRALYLCHGAGMRAVGVAAPLPAGKGLSNNLREVPAAVKAVVQNLFRPDPHFLGPYESDLDQAVAG